MTGLPLRLGGYVVEALWKKVSWEGEKRDFGEIKERE